VNASHSEAAIGKHLERAGIEARVEPTTPNLEDVFVAATRKPTEAAS
jgi:hypothetical protein